MAPMALICGFLMVLGGGFLMLQESATIGIATLLCGVVLLGIGAWLLWRERGHRHEREEQGGPVTH